MKKMSGLRLLVLVALLAFAFVFVGLNLVQGQVTTKGKPDKPPGQDKATKYVWSVVILDGLGMGLKGAAGDMDRYDETWLGWVYDDSESNVNVGVEIRRAPFDGVEKYWTRFYLEIFYPVQIDLDFIPYDAWFYDDTPEACCIYPGGYDEDEPMSMFYFMQDAYHPHPNYQKVNFRFNTDLSVNQNEIDYEQWTNNYHGYMGFLSDIKGTAPSLFKPVTCEDLNLFEFSSIEIGGGDYGYFERMSEDVWKVVVGMENSPYYDYTIGQGEGDDAWATDWYNICVETQINKKKKGVTYDAIFSSQGSMDIKFEILFIRTKI
jgi:hypothetical protein